VLVVGLAVELVLTMTIRGLAIRRFGHQKAPALPGRPGLEEVVAGGGFEPPTFGL
jgi:hypothetical protein